MVSLSGHAIKLSDVRGYLIENGMRTVLLANNMRIVINETDFKVLQDALNNHIYYKREALLMDES